MTGTWGLLGKLPLEGPLSEMFLSCLGQKDFLDSTDFTFNFPYLFILVQGLLKEAWSHNQHHSTVLRCTPRTLP